MAGDNLTIRLIRTHPPWRQTDNCPAHGCCHGKKFRPVYCRSPVRTIQTGHRLDRWFLNILQHVNNLGRQNCRPRLLTNPAHDAVFLPCISIYFFSPLKILSLYPQPLHDGTSTRINSASAPATRQMGFSVSTRAWSALLRTRPSIVNSPSVR